MVSELDKELDEIEPVVVDPERLAAFTSEVDFTGLAVDLLVEVGSYVCVVASILPGNTKCWTRDQAIIGGNVVRLFKLISALLDQTCQHRRETTFIVARLAFETIVNIKYLISFESTELFDSYVRYSLHHERKLYDRIHENIQARGGEQLPVEIRILSSISKTVRLSGVALTDLLPNRPRNWGNKNLFERAEAVGLASVYLAAFGGTSHTVHGNWMDLLEYHLQDAEGGFQPQLEWRHPRPQPLNVIALLATDVIQEYLNHISEQYFGDRRAGLVMAQRLTDLRDRIQRTVQAHEEFLISDSTDDKEE